MAERRRGSDNGKPKEPVDPNNVSPDGVSAEELHPEAEVGPSKSEGVEKAEPSEGPINVDDLPERVAEREQAAKDAAGR